MALPTDIPNNPSDTTLLGRLPRSTDFSSRQLRTNWEQRIKDHATFSARTTNETYLDAVRKVLAAISSRQLSPEDGERQLKSSLQHIGYKPEAGFPDNHGRVPPAVPGSITDLSSSHRIQLIIDTNIKQARSLGQIATSEDPKMLMTAPAWKLTRTGARKKPRGDWRRRWQEAGKACGWHGAAKQQMVALKTSPIWQAIADGAGGFEDTLGSPYPPFAFGSGMAWVNVDWEDWEDLCDKEGIPNYLEDITAKAKELKSAQTAEKPTQLPPERMADTYATAVEESPHAQISPLLERTGSAIVTRPQTTPIAATFKADLSARHKADNAVDDAIDDIRSYRKTVDGYMREIEDILKKCKISAQRESNAEDVFNSMKSRIDSYIADLMKYQSLLKEYEGRVINYGSAIGATPVPTEAGEQRAFDTRMGRLKSATHKTVETAKTVVRSAKMRLEAAMISSGKFNDDMELLKAEGIREDYPVVEFTAHKKITPKKIVINKMSEIKVTESDSPLDMSKTNPHFAETMEYNLNCLNCAVTAYLRTCGFDVEAQPQRKDSTSNALSVWKNHDQYHTIYSPEIMSEITDTMNKWDASMAQIRIVSRTTDYGKSTGHIIIAVRNGGIIRLYDPQSGSEDLAYDAVRNVDMRKLNNGNVWILRIDNNELTDKARQCYKRKN